MTARSDAKSALLALTCVAAASVVGAARAAAPAALESVDGMVVTAQHLASDAGAAILRQGGNAVDAAIAIGYALAVTHPCCGNLGGGGFMIIHLADGRNTFINFREKAPLAARADMFLDAQGNPVGKKSLNGYLAVGVPGTVMGLETARRKYASLPRPVLMAAAIRLADVGFVLTRGDVDELEVGTAQFSAQANVAGIFLEHGAPFKPGERLVQKNLAATLRQVSESGADAFYHGRIAAAVVAAAHANGGLSTMEDFAKYAATESAPLSCRYRGYTILSAPPPSSGGITLCEMLRVLEGYPLSALGFHSSQSVHLMTEAMRFAYRDRNTYLGDPDFIDNPLGRLLSAQHIESIRARILPQRATPSSALTGNAAAEEHANTTHYCVVDAKGNAVSVTYTLNDDFGAKVIAGDTGFFLNDEMDDFTAKPGVANLYGLVQGSANAIAPGKRPLSSMTPTIVLKDGKPVLVVGSPGGSRITTTVLEIIVNVIDHGMTLQEAVDAPRIHHQWLPDTLAGEPFALSADTVTALTHMGYHVVPLDPWGTGNAAEAIGIAPAVAGEAKALGFPRPGLLYGASDSRAPAGSAPDAHSSFKDCADCPAMVVLPAGSFVMGSPSAEESRSDQEGPQHEVTIPRPFAVAVYDVTREDYSKFVHDTGRQSGPSCIVLTHDKAEDTRGMDWRLPGFSQTDRDPVVCVDWNDAQAYVRWLNAKLDSTGGKIPQTASGPYRLLTEAEWEYAARAGTKTRYYWGDDAEYACRYGNTSDESAHRVYPSLKTANCDDGFAATSPVGSFPPNPAGLYDMAGDAFQWVEDCYHPNYIGAPADGSAWFSEDCSEHVIRGGSLGHMPRLMRSAYRFKDATDHRSVFLGFRLAKSID
jgi:gamma-glutamyltranspeptidase/glutathione hydrolase